MSFRVPVGIETNNVNFLMMEKLNHGILSQCTAALYFYSLPAATSESIINYFQMRTFVDKLILSLR